MHSNKETPSRQAFGDFSAPPSSLDYKFDTYQKASDGMTRMATTIIITAGAAVILAPAVQAIAPALKEVILGLS